MKILVEGFQAISDKVEIDVEGLTVITGKSNLGKSSLVRAICAALDNKLGSKFISKSRDSARVLIESNGHKVIWKKTRKTTEYIIDGVQYKKAGKAPPEELKKLGFYQIVSQGEHFRPQIQRQMDKPFMIGEKSPITAAELLSANKESTVLARALRLAKQFGVEELTRLEIQEVELKKLDNKYIELEPIEKVLGISFQKADNVLTLLHLVEEKKTLLGILKSQNEAGVKVLGILKELVKVADLPRVKRFLEVQKVYAEYLRNLARQRALTKVRQLKRLEFSLDSFKLLQVLMVKFVKLRFLKEVLKEFRLKVFEMSIVSFNLVKKVYQDYFNDMYNLQKMRIELLEKEKELKNIEDLKQTLLKELGYCPICGRMENV